MFRTMASALLVGALINPVLAETWVPLDWKGDCFMDSSLIIEGDDRVSFGADLNCRATRNTVVADGKTTVVSSQLVCQTDWPSIEAMSMTITYLTRALGEGRMALAWNGRKPVSYRICEK